MRRFREGAGSGGWLRHTELASQQAGVVLSAVVHSNSHLHTQLLYTSGFTLLAWYFSPPPLSLALSLTIAQLK